MKPTTVMGACLLFLGAVSGRSQDGAFYPLNGAIEGRIGESRFSFSTWQGGVLEWRSPDGRPLGRGGWEGRVALANGRDREVRQEWDRNPEIRYLEEGPWRIGARVHFRLRDGEGLYHGHGMTEVWAYRDGMLYVTTALMFEDPSAHTGITEAAWVIEAPGGPGRVIPLTGQERLAEALVWTNVSSSGRFVLFGSPTWTREHRDFVPRTEGGAPTYYRWPSYLTQHFPGFVPPHRLAPDGPVRTRLEWDTTRSGGRPDPIVGGVFRITPFPERAAEGLRSDREPIRFGLDGGVRHVSARSGGSGYNEQEGVYEIRKTGNPLRVDLPQDPLGRTVRIKVVGLTGHGGIETRVDGQRIVPQLAGDGGIADDPLAPIREPPEGAADMALVELSLGARARLLEVWEGRGVQLAYQNRDPWRSYCLFSDRTGPRWAGFRFSPADGRIRAMRAFGQREYALAENPLTWFLFCGYTPLQMADQLERFQIGENGPERVVFEYASLNANGRVRSEYHVTVPGDSVWNRIIVRASFTVLDSWPYDNVQFFDIFPFRGVNPEEWWYDEVLWIAPDGREKWFRTRERITEGDRELETFSGGGFFAFYPSDRGNMVMLTRNFDPDRPVRYVLCANYIDFHMSVLFRDESQRPIRPLPGTRQSMEYELALWGNGRVTREQIQELGRRSIRAGRLLLP